MREVIFLKDEKSRPNKRWLKGMENFSESAQRANSDVLGSYTGLAQDPDDPTPVQDADDL